MQVSCAKRYSSLNYNSLAKLAFEGQNSKMESMGEISKLFIYFMVTLIKLLKPGGVKAVMAETSRSGNNSLPQVVVEKEHQPLPHLTVSFLGSLLFLLAKVA